MQSLLADESNVVTSSQISKLWEIVCCNPFKENHNGNGPAS
jgi:hypothetical protein